jgi:hypothetical protein
VKRTTYDIAPAATPIARDDAPGLRGFAAGSSGLGAVDALG